MNGLMHAFEIRQESHTSLRESRTNDRRPEREHREERKSQPPAAEHTLVEEIRYAYIRLVLSTPFLKAELRGRLQEFGIECLEEGAPYEAFGIVSETQQMIAILDRVEEVLAVERGEPACSK